MTKTTLGTILIILGTLLVLGGGFLAALLLTGGGPIFPHIIGPIILVGVGATLIVVTRKAIKIS